MRNERMAEHLNCKGVSETMWSVYFEWHTRAEWKQRGPLYKHNIYFYNILSKILFDL